MAKVLSYESNIITISVFLSIGGVHAHGCYLTRGENLWQMRSIETGLNIPQSGVPTVIIVIKS